MSEAERLLQFFSFAHLPSHLREISEPIGIMARQLVERLPDNLERDEVVRKLLEAKDCAVRAVLFVAE